MKKPKVNLATTFNEDGYRLYGKKWIETVSKFWPETVTVTLYTDVDIPDLPSNFTVKSFSDSFPEHPEFIERVSTYFDEAARNSPDYTLRVKAPHFSELTIKFSHKAFVIERELTRTDADIFIWLDGDVETIANIKETDFKNILKDRFLACQAEKANTLHLHIESGILIFNLTHKLTKRFTEQLTDFYHTDRLFNVRKPYDGFVIGRILRNNKKLKYIDFNSWRKDLALTSKRGTTFLHPFLRRRFVHWIAGSKNELED